MDPELMTTRAEIDEFLTNKYEKVEKMRWKSLAGIGEYLKN